LAATGLSLTGFFFPLLQPMLGMVGQPTIRQQGLQARCVAGAMSPPLQIGGWHRCQTL
jgi:hypothetical protein